MIREGVAKWDEGGERRDADAGRTRAQGCPESLMTDGGC